MKRFVDILVAAVGLLALSPFFAIIAVAIWLDDGGPVFFTQTRAGQDGVPFSIWKFRTLPDSPTASCPTASTSQRATPKHPAHHPAHFATRVGAVLRAWSVDELPQLWNVLRGEMSLVGPRPTLPEQVARYGSRERTRLRVPPGLTGWAQIHGRNTLSWPKRIDLDIWYVHHWTLGLDVRILLRTPAVILSGDDVDGLGGINPDFPSTPTAPSPASSASSPTPHTDS